MTTNTQYNPILRATRAAFAELTTPDARRWYRQQLLTSAALASQGLTHVRRWLNASRGQIAVVEPEQQGDSTEIEPAQVSAPIETTASELGDTPAVWNAIEANGNIGTTLSQQSVSGDETPPPAADLEHEPKTSVLATIEPGASLDYKQLNDLQERPIETDDEPLPNAETPFWDALETGSPFPKEEDDSSLDELEKDNNADSRLEGALEPAAIPSALSARIQAYLQAQDISVETEDEAQVTHSLTPARSDNADSTEVVD